MFCVKVVCSEKMFIELCIRKQKKRNSAATHISQFVKICSPILKQNLCQSNVLK